MMRPLDSLAGVWFNTATMTTIRTITPHMRHEAQRAAESAADFRDELYRHPANSAARNLAPTVSRLINAILAPDFTDYPAAVELSRQIDAWTAHIIITGRAIALHGSLTYCIGELAAAVDEVHYSQTAAH